MRQLVALRVGGRLEWRGVPARCPVPALLILALALAAAEVSGCGGEAVAPRAQPGALAPGQTLVAALGDSIVAGSPLWDPDPEIRDSLGGSLDPESQFEVWAEARSDGALRFRNCGVFGERTDQIAARLEDCARTADVLLLQGGINDIAQFRRVRTAADNLRATVRAGRERGLRVVIAEVLPWNNGYPFASGRIRRLNREIAAIGREEGVEVLPFYATLEDRKRPGRMRRRWTVDGDHPSVEGYRRLGELVAERLIALSR